MKSAIPGEIVNAGGSFEKDDWLAGCEWRISNDEFREACHCEIVEVARKSAFEALNVEFFKHTFFHMSLRGAMQWRQSNLELGFYLRLPRPLASLGARNDITNHYSSHIPTSLPNPRLHL